VKGSAGHGSAGGDLHLVVNGEQLLVPGSTTLTTLVALVGIGSRGIAVAIDGQVVPRSAWPTTTLSSGARIEIVSAAAGG
jgi:sulfur carrier protein